MKRYIPILFLLLFFLTACNDTPTETRTTVFAGQVLSCNFGSAFPDADVADPPHLTVHENLISVRVVSADGSVTKSAAYSLSGERNDASVIGGVHDPKAVAEGAHVTDAFSLGDDSGRYVQYEIRYTEEESFAQAVLKNAGHVFCVLHPAADLGYDLKYDNPRAGEIFSVTDVVYTPSENGGYLLLLTDQGLCCYNDSGTLLWAERGNLTRDIVRVGKDIYVLRQKADAQTLHLLDCADGSRSDAISVTGEAVLFRALGENDMLFTGGGHDLYTANENGIFTLDVSEDRTAALCTKIMDFALSDVLPDSILGIAVTDDKTVYLALDDITGEFGGARLWRYTEIPAESLPQKTELVLAIFSAQNAYQLPVYHFNREHEDVRIVVRDYRVYEDEEERVMRFNADIMAGDTPDMVLLWQNSNYGTSVSTYERSGLFADLKPILSDDPEFDYDGLLSYVTNPYTLEDGGQYIFPLQPGATTYFADPAVVSEPMTVDAFLDLYESFGAKPWQGMNLIAAAVDDFYHEETAICSFDDGRLEALLSRAERMAENEGNNPLVYLRLPYPTLWYYVSQMQKATGGMLSSDAMPLTPVGIPNETGELCVDYSVSEYFAITRACEHPDAAVDFLQMLMDANKIYNTPLDQLYWHRFDGGLGQTYYAEDVREELTYYAGKTLVYEDNAYYIYADDDPALADAPGWHFKITDAAADAFVSYLDSITRRVNYGSPAASIFREEYRVMADRPIGDRLKIIQSKVSIYLSEQLD